MARIIVPLNEAIYVLQANVDLGSFIRRIEATSSGPKLIVGFPPLIREANIMIRFMRFENGTALFSLEGVPQFLNLNSVLKLPQGIAVSGTTLRIEPDTLLRTQLSLKGLTVRNVAWDNGAFVIDTAAN